VIRRVAFAKALAAGAVGALVWEAAYRLLSLSLPLKFDLVWALGTLVFPVGGIWEWWPAGMAAHLCVGGVWAVFYAYFFWSALKARPLVQGLVFSVVPAIAAGLCLVPQFKYLHPLIVSGLRPDYGFFAFNLGWQGSIDIFLFHFIYGLTMGSLYRRPAGYAVSRETKPLKWKRPRHTLAKAPEAIKALSFPSGNFMFCTGIECSYPTIEGGKWRMDEAELTGHYENWEKDIGLVHELGIPYLRYGPPLPWIFKGPGRYDWDFLDAVLSRIHSLGIVPILDLCHFGLPAWMGNFQSTDFPRYLSEYAGAMADRYSFLRFWNPVNEMYVAARESAIHGAWNEQQRSEQAFVRATCNMVRASHLVTAAVRAKRPDAVFITSESSEFYQACCPDDRVTRTADFENQRRFMASDLFLSVPVRDDIKGYLLANGMLGSEYDEFMSAKIGSRVIMGLDYYPWNEKLINSEGNTESLGELFGWYVITKQYYERYKRPLFHSETNSMDARQGPSWLWRQWHNLQLMRSEGIPVVGFTWYSLQDQIDWNVGVSEPLGNVNPVGLFDLNRDPRPVSIAFRQLLNLFGNETIPAPLAREFAL
jgi:beta-glucosidase/6-phospho-beta-glucosidase/beta-galactosidase